MEMNGETGRARHPGLRVAALAAAILPASLGVSVVTVALPTLARDFALSVVAAQWAVLAYLLAVTATVVIAGRLGDLIGRRRVLIAGLAIFAAASALCGAAPSFGWLVAARMVQGLGGAVLMALPVSMIRDAVAKERVGSAMGTLGAASAVGTALGPSLGGAIIAGWGWRATFVILAAMALIALIVAARALPADRADRADCADCADGRAGRARLDARGALALAATLTAFSLAVSGGWGGFSTSRILLIAAAALGALVFVAIERGAQTPLVAPAALSERGVSASLLSNLLVSNVMMATLVVGPFYLSFALRLNEALVGLIMAVGPAASALSGVPAGRLTDRFGAKPMLIMGLGQIVVGLLCLSVLPERFGVVGYILSLTLLTPGYQLFLAANNTMVMQAAGEDQRGVISGMLGLSRNLGFMIGASVMGAVFARALDAPDIAQAAPAAVGAAFAATFQIAAGLIAGVVVLALRGRVRGR